MKRKLLSVFMIVAMVASCAGFAFADSPAENLEADINEEALEVFFADENLEEILALEEGAVYISDIYDENGEVIGESITAAAADGTYTKSLDVKTSLQNGSYKATIKYRFLNKGKAIQFYGSPQSTIKVLTRPSNCGITSYQGSVTVKNSGTSATANKIFNFIGIDHNPAVVVTVTAKISSGSVNWTSSASKH